jgi:hypothetical protein
MNWVVPIAPILQILLLLYVATIDVALADDRRTCR